MYDTRDSTKTEQSVEPANKPRCVLIKRLRDAHSLHLLHPYPPRALVKLGPEK